MTESKTPKGSFRWLYTDAYDVDAYEITPNNHWFLFVTLKDPNQKPEVLFPILAKRFQTIGVICGFGGALKTKGHSEPLEYRSPDGSKPSEPPSELWAIENDIQFRLETSKVLNPGLFLDQSENRKILLEKIKNSVRIEGEELLNLFSYTGSFSVVASCAGVAHTTSVDVSSRYLAWEKLNHEANASVEREACAGDPVHRLIKEDARVFVKRAVSKQKKFRWIVLDPPTFSKGQGKSFSVERDYTSLLENCLACLTPDGLMLASMNDSRWGAKDYYSALREIAEKRGLGFKQGMNPGGSSMKSVWITSSPRADG